MSCSTFSRCSTLTGFFLAKVNDFVFCDFQISWRDDQNIHNRKLWGNCRRFACPVKTKSFLPPSYMKDIFKGLSKSHWDFLQEWKYFSLNLFHTFFALLKIAGNSDHFTDNFFRKHFYWLLCQSFVALCHSARNLTRCCYFVYKK